MTLFDISRPLRAGMVVWPGDTPFALQSILQRRLGASVNLTTLVMSAHTGAHVDAPYHFADAGATLESLPLEPFWGLAQVVTVAKPGGPLRPADFAHADLRRAPRLLVHSAASHLDPTRFPDEFVYPTPELAAYLGEMGVILYGVDAPSMDHAASPDLPGHHALLQYGIHILEGLDLSAVADGVYELSALPLAVVGGDGSPVRAVLRTLS